MKCLYQVGLDVLNCPQCAPGHARYGRARALGACFPSQRWIRGPVWYIQTAKALGAWPQQSPCVILIRQVSPASFVAATLAPLSVSATATQFQWLPTTPPCQLVAAGTMSTMILGRDCCHRSNPPVAKACCRHRHLGGGSVVWGLTRSTPSIWGLRRGDCDQRAQETWQCRHCSHMPCDRNL